MSTVQAIAGILLVFGLLALFYWGAYRFSGGRGFPRRSSRIEILETRGIGDKRALLLVRVGSGTFLVGSTTQQISLLSEIDPTASDATVTGDAEVGEVVAGELNAVDSRGNRPEKVEPEKEAPLPRMLPHPGFRAFLEMFR